MLNQTPTMNHSVTKSPCLLWLCEALMVFALVGLAFAPALRGEFLWDDDRYVVSNPFVKSATGIFEIWTTWQQEVNYWPVSNSVFWLEYQIWGENTWGYHLVNLLLHALNAILLISLLRKLGMRHALAVGLLFAVHPLNVESVAWICEVKNLISLFFLLGSLWFYTNFLKERGKLTYSLSLCFCLLALLSKTAACALPIMISLMEYYLSPTKRVFAWKRQLPFYLVTAFFVLFFYYAEQIEQQRLHFSIQFNIVEQLWIAVTSLLFYGYKFFLPYPLLTVYPQQLWQGSAEQILLMVTVLLGALLYFFILFKKKQSVIFILSLIIVLNLLPILGLVPHMLLDRTYVMDHFSYFALPGMVVLLVLGLQRLDEKFYPTRPDLQIQDKIQTNLPGIILNLDFRVRLIRGLVYILLLGMTGLSFQQSQIYRNGVLLWSHTLEYYPQSFFAHYSLGVEFLKAQQWQHAKQHFDQAIENNANYALNYINRGYSYVNLNQYSLAYADFDRAVQIDPHHALAWNNRGLVKHLQGDNTIALKNFDQAIVLAPERGQFYLNRAKTLFALNQPQQALQDLDQAVRWQPSLVDAWKEKLKLQEQANDSQGVLNSLNQIVQLQPQDVEMRNRRAAYYIGQGQWERALVDLNHVLKLNPQMKEAWVNRGIVYFEQSRNLTEACQNWLKACDLGSCQTWEEAVQNQDCQKRGEQAPHTPM